MAQGSWTASNASEIATSEASSEASRGAVDGREALLRSVTVNVTAPIAGNWCVRDG